MPMQTMPPMTSNRPQSELQKFTTGGGLQDLRKTALSNISSGPGSAAPALRQANTIGPAVATQGDFDTVNSQYAAWFQQQKAAGLSDEQIAALPQFQAWQNKITTLAGQATDMGMIDKQIGAMNTSGQDISKPYQQAQFNIRDAFEARKKQLGLPNPMPSQDATPATPTTGGAGNESTAPSQPSTKPATPSLGISPMPSTLPSAGSIRDRIMGGGRGLSGVLSAPTAPQTQQNPGDAERMDYR